MPDAHPGPLWDGPRDAAVRDLAWLLASADLFGERPRAALARPWEIAGLAAWCVPWLDRLARDPAPLHAVLAEAKATRLGRYAETLLKFFIEEAAPLTLVAANLPLRSHGRTVGEYDFLLETAQGQRLHWELAVKCYLGAPHAGAARLADFVGPNLADQLDLKYTHLIEHQLRLADHAAFAALGHAGPWLPQLFGKGWLFHHRGEAGALPPELNRAHERGFWVTHGEWEEWAARYPAGTVWIVLPRLAWLAPRRFAAAAPDSAARLGMQASPILAAALLPQMDMSAVHAPPGAGWQEIARGFVVPDDWPERAAAYARSA